MPNILIIRSNDINPDPRVERLAKMLFNNGYNISILGTDFTGNLNNENTEFYSLYRLKIRKRFKLTGLLNIYYLLILQYKIMFWLLKNIKKYDIIHACDFDTIIPALIIKYLKKIPVIYDIFDFYSDMLKKTPKLLKVIIKKIDYKAISLADTVIITDKFRKSQIGGAKPKRLLIIYNTPEDLKNGFKYEKHQKKLKIIYTGLLTKERGIFEAINVIKNHPEWEFTMIGSGVAQNEIVNRIREMNNIYFDGKKNYLESLKITNENDVVLITYDPKIRNNKYSSPNKLFEAMMLGKPVIINKESIISRIVEKYNNGIIIPYGDEKSLEKALIILEDYSNYQKMSFNSRMAYEKEFGWDKMSFDLNKLYEELLNR